MYQTAPSIWTIRRDKPVILGVTFLSHSEPIKSSRRFARTDFRLCISCFSKYSQISFCSYTQLQISTLDELIFVPYRYVFCRVPPQPNCPQAAVLSKKVSNPLIGEQYYTVAPQSPKQLLQNSYLFYASLKKLQQQAAVKFHKVLASHQMSPALSPVSAFRRFWLGTATTSLNHSCKSPFRRQGITLP